MVKPEIQTSFSPELFKYYKDDDAIVVIVDVLRATSAICTAFHHGVARMIPVASVDEARKLKSQGFMAACERDAVKQDGFDFGNSPYHFMTNKVVGETIVISTTNGTQAIEAAKGSSTIAIGSFLNLSALADWLVNQNKKVIILCAGWKNRYNMEDALFAGALALRLLEAGSHQSTCDSTISSGHLYKIASANLYQFLENSSHRNRLQHLQLEEDIHFCLTPDYTRVIPILQAEGLVNMRAELTESSR